MIPFALRAISEVRRNCRAATAHSIREAFFEFRNVLCQHRRSARASVGKHHVVGSKPVNPADVVNLAPNGEIRFVRIKRRYVKSDKIAVR